MQQRRLAAVMFTDIAGYTALMGKDEDRAFEVLHVNKEIHTQLIEKYHGTLLKEMGDGLLISFNSSVDAVRCAIEIQEECKKKGIPLKIGIHEGDMVFAGNDVLGDGVNIASRLESVTETGNITISEAIYHNVKNKTGIYTAFLEEKQLKNVAEPFKIYQVSDQEIKVGRRPQKVGKLSGKKAIYLGIAIGAILVAVIILWKFLPSMEKNTSSAEAEPDKSIAVLPFKNVSSDPENEFFCFGMLTEILTHLQKIADLKVKSRTAVEKYSGTTIDIKTIEDELGVSYFLEGSVRKVGNNLRITAALIDVKSGDQLWTEKYDGAYTDTVFVVQATIAKRIASSLNAAITPFVEEQIDKKPTSDIRAYQKYTKGRQYLVKSDFGFTDKEEFKMAEKLYRESLEIDPEFARGYSGLAEIYLIKSGPIFSEEVMDSAYYFAEKAIEYDPNLGVGYKWKGDYFQRKGDFEKALDSYEKAVKLDPNNAWFYRTIAQIYFKHIHDYKLGAVYLKKAEELLIEKAEESQTEPKADLFIVYQWLGDMYLDIEDFEKAEKYYIKSLEIKPDCHSIGHLNVIMEVKGEWDKAIDFLDSMINVTPDCPYINHCRFYHYLNKKEFSQAEEYLNLWIKGGNPFPYFSRDSTAYAYMIKGFGREQEASTILNNALSSFKNQLNKNPSFSTYIDLARIHSILGEKDEALKYLLEAAKFKFAIFSWGWYDYIEIDPTFENLHNDLKFQAIVKQARDEKAAIRAQIQEIMEQEDIDL